jgi:hypothetical protein
VGCGIVLRGHLIVVVRAFLIGCAFRLLIVGCSGPRSEAPQEGQGHTEATKELTRSPEATASEEARCEGTRTYYSYLVVSKRDRAVYRTGSEEDMKKAGKVLDVRVYTTNDLPGCPKGGQLLGTDKSDRLKGIDGEDKVRGLAGSDHELAGGPGSDILYGGDGDDYLVSGKGEDVMYGGDGNDLLFNYDEQRDKLYCGEGRDEYLAGKNDYVDSSCEKEDPGG